MATAVRASLPRSSRQRRGKLVAALAMKGDFKVATLRSQTFDTLWPPVSKRDQPFREIDRTEWITLEQVCAKIIPARRSFLDRLEVFRANGGQQ